MSHSASGLSTTSRRAADKAREGIQTVLVTDAARGSAVCIIRSLGRRGYRVIAADSDARSPGFASRYTSARLLHPPAEAEPDGAVAAIHDTVREQGVDLVIPITDALILPLAKARERFAGLCRLAIPETEALEVVTNKARTLELANRLGVPVPRTRLVHTTEEALQHGPGMGWPIVLKPQVSRLYREQESVESFTVCYADTPERLAERMARFEGRCPVLLQQFCSGTAYGVELLLHEGRPLAAFQHKRLRELPISGGASAFRESVPLDPALYDYSVRLMQALRWTGLAMVEFKAGENGPVLMEINGRVWGSLPLAVHSGMDFPARLTDLCLCGPPEEVEAPHTGYRVGVRSRNLVADVAWILSVLTGRRRYPFLAMPRRREAVRALLQLFDPRCKFDIVSLSDPRPGRAELAVLLRLISRKYREGLS